MQSKASQYVMSTSTTKYNHGLTLSLVMERAGLEDYQRLCFSSIAWQDKQQTRGLLLQRQAHSTQCIAWHEKQQTQGLVLQSQAQSMQKTMQCT
jgi:hypothetical protein